MAALARAVGVTPGVPFTSNKMGGTPPWRGVMWWSQKAVIRLGIHVGARTEKTKMEWSVTDKEETRII